MAFGFITKTDFKFEGGTPDQWQAELSFRRICAETAARLLRESKKKRAEDKAA